MRSLSRGAIAYPTRNFAKAVALVTYRLGKSIGGPSVSAGLPTSPQGSDHLIISSRDHNETVGVWPLRILGITPEPFLLIFRTSHIVTAITAQSRNEWRVVEDTPGFPAYSRLRTAPSPMRGAAASQITGGFLP